MSASAAPAPRPGPGRVWLLIPALWLFVAIAGMFAMSHRPEWFAQDPRAESSSASGGGLEAAAEASAISTNSTELHRRGDRATNAGYIQRADGH